MARGFWHGLTHGVVIAGAGLVVLSLIAPLPETTQDSVISIPDEAAQATKSAPEIERPRNAGPQPAEQTPPPASDSDKARPEAANVIVPAGSEFARGDDIAPQQPIPLAATGAGGIKAAPVVNIPQAEPAPAPINSVAVRPEAVDIGQKPAPVEAQQIETAPDFTRPAGLQTTASAPRIQALPTEDARDLQPDWRSIAAEAAGETNAAPDLDPLADDRTLDMPATPGMTAPAPDLSLPPDLSDLNMQERN